MTRHRHKQHSGTVGEHSTPVIPFWKDPTGVSSATFLMACLVFGSGLIFGGSGGSFGDTIVQLLSLPLIVLAAIQWTRCKLRGPDWAGLAIIAGIAVLAFIQLAPMPLSIWASLPGRADLLRHMQSVGVAPAWRSLSLNPFATERALLWTLPAIAVFLAVRWMSSRQRSALLVMLFLGAIGLLVLKLLQHSAAPNNALATANMALARASLALPSLQTLPPAALSMTSLFANRNNFATFLAMTIPLVLAMGIRVWVERSRGKPTAWALRTSLLAIVALGLMAGLMQTQSRFALVLSGLSLLGSLMLLRNIGLDRKAIWAIAACAFVGLLLAFQMGASSTLSRFQSPRFDYSGLHDARWPIHATTLQAARHFGVLGSGLGTFVQAYQQTAPENESGPGYDPGYFTQGYDSGYVNHAHSDYHEIWLEAGLPGALLVIAFLVWFGWSSWRLWGVTEKSAALTLIARAASLSILMLLMHSYLDWPLRKTAILVAFGMSCALLAPTNETMVQRAHQRRIAKA